MPSAIPNIKRRWLVIALCVVAVATSAVVLTLTWKPMLERIYLGEAVGILGEWRIDSGKAQVVTTPPVIDRGLLLVHRIRFSSRHGGLFQLALEGKRTTRFAPGGCSRLPFTSASPVFEVLRCHGSEDDGSDGRVMIFAT